MPTVVGTPSEINVVSGEIAPVQFDFTNYIGLGDAVSNPTFTVVDLKTGLSVPNMLSDASGISGFVVSQSFTNFIPKRQYRVKCLATLNTGKTLAILVTLTCTE